MSTHESMAALRLAFTNVALLSVAQVGASFVPVDRDRERLGRARVVPVVQGPSVVVSVEPDRGDPVRVRRERVGQDAVGDTAGATVKRVGFESESITKSTTWVDSSGGPSRMFVAQPVTV